MSLEQYKDANRKELWEILQIQVERIAELETMLAGRTKEVDRWITWFDRAVGKQQYIIESQKVKIAELEADNKRLKTKVFASFNKPLKEQE
jgi:hypothetical protein